MLQFSEKLYVLDVADVPRDEVPRIVDPNNVMKSGAGTVICYNPTKTQLIQLALIIWQVATKERNALQVGTRQFEAAEGRCTKTRNVLKSLLLPFVAGNTEKARDLCVTLLRDNKPILDKHIKKWTIIKRPNSVWVDEDTNGIFLCENGGRVLVGVNPTNYVFVYNQGK